MSPTVSLTDVCKSYTEGGNHRQVLSNLSLQADAGEAVALLGASGSGKSTLLNIISGLIVPDSGKVLVDGVDISKLSTPERTHFRRQKIGFVFQFFHLVPTLTVGENLRLPLQLNDMDDEEGRERAQRLLRQVGLDGRSETFPDRLSGGEQQRVAVCRALVHQPPLILADEPTGNLDEETAGEVLNLVLDLAKENEAALLVVTHSQGVADLCDRTCRLRNGKFAGSAG